MLPVPVIQLRPMTTTATDVDVTTATMWCGVFLGFKDVLSFLGSLSSLSELYSNYY